MKLFTILILFVATLTFAVDVGDKCPEYQVDKKFVDGTYLLEEIDNKMILCRPPNNIDSLLVVFGLFTRDSLFDRVAGIRYFKYDHGRYSKEDVKAIFGITLDKSYMRRDGLYQIHDKDNDYHTISTNKNSFGFVEYSPSFKMNICGIDGNSSYYDYSLIEFDHAMYNCYDYPIPAYTNFLFERFRQLKTGKELTFCKRTIDDSLCVEDVRRSNSVWIYLNGGRNFVIFRHSYSNSLNISMEEGLTRRTSKRSKGKSR